MGLEGKEAERATIVRARAVTQDGTPIGQARLDPHIGSATAQTIDHLPGVKPLTASTKTLHTARRVLTGEYASDNLALIAVGIATIDVACSIILEVVNLMGAAWPAIVILTALTLVPLAELGRRTTVNQIKQRRSEKTEKSESN